MLNNALLKNWTDSSERYSKQIQGELGSQKRVVWSQVIREETGGRAPLKALDVGTGPGFFAALLAKEGHDVCAIDCTEAMLHEAKANAAEEGLQVDFRLSDAHKTDFPDACFDVVISRNVTWTLIDAEAAYREWRRILKPDGTLFIFDANWNLRLFDEELMKEYEKDASEYRQKYGEEPHIFTKEMLDFRRAMPMCRRVRPQWDCGALINAGFRKISFDLDIWKRVFDEKEKLKYRTCPLFMLKASGY